MENARQIDSGLNGQSPQTDEADPERTTQNGLKTESSETIEDGRRRLRGSRKSLNPKRSKVNDQVNLDDLVAATVESSVDFKSTESFVDFKSTESSVDFKSLESSVDLVNGNSSSSSSGGEIGHIVVDIGTEMIKSKSMTERLVKSPPAPRNTSAADAAPSGEITKDESSSQDDKKMNIEILRNASEHRERCSEHDDKNHVSLCCLETAGCSSSSMSTNETNNVIRAIETSFVDFKMEDIVEDLHVELKDADNKILSSVNDRTDYDARKTEKTKPPDISHRPFARLLHDLGQEMVRQIVYKDLIDIQVAKDTKNRLDDKDKTQLTKLTEAHTKLCAKNDAYRLPPQLCRCGFASCSDNVMRWHREFGHSIDQFPNVCCYCDVFKSKWPSQFVAHMETTHDVKARLQKKLASHVCFFCPYEHKNWIKMEMHVAKCATKFSLSNNLLPQPSDCDIPVLYKVGQAQKIYPFNQHSLPTMAAGRFPSQPSIQGTSPLTGVTTGQSSSSSSPSSSSTSSVMEIDGQLYSLVNHNGKVLLTSLRSQISGATPASGHGLPRSVTTGTVKTQFASPKVLQPALEAAASKAAASALPAKRETCEICSTVVSNREALWSHFRDTHRVELSKTSMREQEPWMKCTICNTRYWTYQGLARHSSNFHNRNIAPLPQAMSPSRSLRCYLCANSQTSNPLNHFSTLHNITLLDMYQSRHCCMCNKRLKQSRAFEEHMIVHHRDIFANSDVLRTVIQALSTAYYLKAEEGMLNCSRVMVQQQQQQQHQRSMMASSGTGFSKASPASGGGGTHHNNAALPTQTSVVRNTMSTPPGLNFRNASQTPYGLKLIPQMPVGFKNAMMSPSTILKSTPPTSASTAQPQKVRSSSETKRGGRTKSSDRSASPGVKTPDKKSREEDEKDLNKLYEKLSDIGRPILRSMRHKLSQNEQESDCREKRSSEEQTDLTDGSPDAKAEGQEPDRKKLRLEAPTTTAVSTSSSSVGERSDEVVELNGDVIRIVEIPETSS